MNVLFILKFHRIGGIEIVSRQLANIFVSKGHNVSILSLDPEGDLTMPVLDSSVKFYIGHGFNTNKENVRLLRNILIANNINIVINQWGLPYTGVTLFRRASKGLSKIKFISAYHNDPVSNARTKKIEEQLLKRNGIINEILLRIKLLLTRVITGLSMNYVYRHSDYYILLSESFVDGFRKFAFNNGRKSVVCPNPLTIRFPEKLFSENKIREVLYVGRLELNQKRVDRVLDIWNELHQNYQDWALTLVGDGIDKVKLEKRALELGLLNCQFAGFQVPNKYYERASVLLLTSDYEGFGLVLIEAMAYGVIPVVLGSYSAAYDIIDHNINGFIIETPFSIQKFKDILEKLFNDEQYRLHISFNAVRKSKAYTNDNIYKCWVPLLT